MVKLIDPSIDHAILAIAPQFSLAPNLVRAICEVESSFNPWAYRYEPQYKYLVGDKLTMSETERIGQMCSWGLMQVMGGVARESGFRGYLPQLCDPNIGLNYGCKHLAKFFTKYLNWPDAIASYNAGSPRKNLADGGYVNQVYVDRVYRAWNLYEQHAQV